MEYFAPYIFVSFSHFVLDVNYLVYVQIYYINLESRIPVDLLRRFIRFETDKNVSRLE